MKPKIIVLFGSFVAAQARQGDSPLILKDGTIHLLLVGRILTILEMILKVHSGSVVKKDVVMIHQK